MTCSFDTHNGLPKLKDPLLLIESSAGTSVVYPANEVGLIFLQVNEKLLVACPGKKSQQNKVLVNKKEIAVGICNGQKNIVEFEGKVTTATDLQCEYAISPELKVTNNKCGNGVGVFLEIGYSIVSTLPNVQLIFICVYVN